jgi:hypothetical protein
MLAMPNRSLQYFSSLKICCTVKSLKRAIFSMHFSRYEFKDPSSHWIVPAICCTTNNESPDASICFMFMTLRICRPNKMVSYLA